MQRLRCRKTGVCVCMHICACIFVMMHVLTGVKSLKCVRCRNLLTFWWGGGRQQAGLTWRQRWVAGRAKMPVFQQMRGDWKEESWLSGRWSAPGEMPISFTFRSGCSCCRWSTRFMQNWVRLQVQVYLHFTDRDPETQRARWGTHVHELESDRSRTLSWSRGAGAAHNRSPKCQRNRPLPATT